MLGWWEYVQLNPSKTKKCRNIIRLLFDCHSLKSCKFRYKKAMDPYCERCDGMLVENIEHIMFYCPANTQIRVETFEKLQGICPPAMYTDIVNLPISERTKFFLSGLNNSFIQEWNVIFDVLVDFVNRIYMSHINTS